MPQLSSDERQNRPASWCGRPRPKYGRMVKSRRAQQIFILAATILALPAALPGQVRVLISGGFSAAYQELLPQFQNTTGITVTTLRGASQGEGPNTIGAQIRRGVPADV